MGWICASALYFVLNLIVSACIIRHFKRQIRSLADEHCDFRTRESIKRNLKWLPQLELWIRTMCGRGQQNVISVQNAPRNVGANNCNQSIRRQDPVERRRQSYARYSASQQITRFENGATANVMTGDPDNM